MGSPTIGACFFLQDAGLTSVLYEPLSNGTSRRNRTVHRTEDRALILGSLAPEPETSSRYDAFNMADYNANIFSLAFFPIRQAILMPLSFG